MTQSCKTCAFLVLADRGYSNWTVEETEIICLTDAHPHLPATTSYPDESRDPVYAYAADCPAYLEGKPLLLDVDRNDGGPYELATEPAVQLLLELKGLTDRYSL